MIQRCFPQIKKTNQQNNNNNNNQNNEQNLKIIGSFSNNDGDGNEDVKKAIGSLRKTTTLHVSFVHFFTVLARLRRETDA